MSLRLLWNPRRFLSGTATLASLTIAMLVSASGGFAQTPVPDGFLSHPKSARVGLNLGRDAQPFIIGIDGRNTTTGPIQLAAPVIGPLLSVEGDVSTQAATRKPVELRANSCKDEIKPGQSCAISLALPPDLGAGRYTIDVMLSGPGGGQSARTIPINVRASPWLAGLVIAIGVALGALVTDWRTAARPVTNRRIEAASLRENARKLAGSSAQPAVQARARELVRELRAADADIIAGKDVTQTLAEHQRRLEILRRADQLLNAAGAPQGEAADIFKPLAHRLAATLDAVDWQEAEIEAAGKTLASELAGFQRLYDAAVAYNSVAQRLSAGVDRCGAAQAIQKDWADAKLLRERAFDGVTGTAAAGTTEVAKRATDLEAATRKLADQTGAIASSVLAELQAAIAEKLKDTDLKPPGRKDLEDMARQAKTLAASAENPQAKIDKAVRLWADFDGLSPSLEATTEGAAGPAIPNILPDDSGLKYEWAVETFQPAVGASAAALQRSLQRWNWITSLVTLAGIAAVGVLVLWVPNTAWGTVQDVILAILGGAGTRLAIGTIATPGGTPS
jgi:hypothetical protein